MGSRPLALCFLLLLLVSFHAHDFPRCADARPLPFEKLQRYVGVLGSLGIVCRCCDGEAGECRSRWESTCAKLDCHPSKF
ncbi:hypothetical protein ACMD2_27110 [Ananas comosus]|uniref:Uncharacterized protein n=1 Tax=Ananas comosus TaxID=4615 RepID=A0A199UNF3_ANACO|nr:hypothetical protein ACMD2_27110 [Ananas comosus]